MHRTLAPVLVAVPALALGVAAASLAGAGGALGSEVWIDGPTELSPGMDPNFPDVAVAEDGRRVFVWKAFVAGRRDDVYRRLFDAAGTPLEDPVLVNTLLDDDQINPRIAMAGDGSFVVVWQSDEDDGGVDRRWVRSQAFGADGTPVGSEQLVSALSSGKATDIHADVAALRTSDGTGGGYAVVWESANTTGGDSGNSIQGRLLSASGVPLGGQLQVNATTGENERASAVTELADGGFLVVWAHDELMGRRFTAAGAPVGTDFQINTGPTRQKLDPDAAIGWDGRVAVVWRDAESVGDREIRMRLYDAGLAPLGDEFRVNTLLDGDQVQPRVGDLGPGGFLVVWEGFTSVGDDDDGSSVQARTVTGPDEFAGPQAQLNVFTEDAQQSPAAQGRSGWVATAWRSAAHAGDPVEPIIAARLADHCLFCDDLEWGSTWRWSATMD